jgi:hypothetical protein
MKKRTLLPAILVLVVISISSCSNEKDANMPADNENALGSERDTSKAKKFPLMSAINFSMDINQNIFLVADGEPPLDQTIPAVPTSFAENIIESAPGYLFVKGMPLTLMAAEIPTAAVITLSNAAAQLTCDPACTSTNQVAGVRISYGVNSTFKLVLYYRPLLFCFQHAHYGQGGRLYGNYSLCKEGDYYYNNGGQLERVQDQNLMQVELTRYKDKTEGVGIKRDLTAPTETFNTTQDITGDVEALIFPMQEILTICKSSDKSKMRFWNAVEKIVLDNNVQLIKHTLLMSSETVSVTAGNLIFPPNAMFSNLSHICPPSCNNNNFNFVLVTKL